jgi:heme/copper-type cytochrome/quinol oxidase subunit 3
MEATTPAEVARADRLRIAHANGWWGALVFVLTEATLFIMLVGTYDYLRFKTPHWPPPGVPEPKVLLPVILTGILVASSIPMQIAVAAARSGWAGRARAGVAAALVLQAGYLGAQLHLYISDLDKFQPSGSAYASIYYTLLGAHHTHVAVGILLDAWLLLRLAGGLTNYRFVGLQATAFYWHFINVVAVVVVLTQISPRF